MFEDENLEDEDLGLAEYESRTMRFLAKYFPFLLVSFVKFIHRKDFKRAEAFHEVLSKSKRIDIFPTKCGGRGFILIIDQQTALFFYQDGDKFIYDGWETGEYEKGKVTVFDNCED